MELYMIEVNMADAPPAWAWFRDVLGLSVLIEDAPHGFALLAAGPARLAVKQNAHGPASGYSLVFHVEDLADERRRLAQRGISVGEVLTNRAEGYEEFGLYGPEGISVRLFAWIGSGISSR